MNSFGLGLILSFVDNASAGMSSATSTFNRMSATADSLTSSVSASATEIASVAFSLSAVGDTFSSVGQSIIGMFMGITQQVIDTGGQMQGFRMQLSALYKDQAESKLQEIKDYAAKSVFEVESLMSAVTVMKAVGIEAMDEVTTSSGNTTQRLMDYASDIAGMIPNMTNMYGTGVNAAMGALKEYIAEGNAMSLKRGAGLDITGLLGEDKGKTIEERTRQIADLVEMLGIAGYTKNLEGTPTQQLAKLSDTLYNLKADIADNGVFDSYVSLLSKLSSWIESLTDNTELYSSVLSVLGDTISALLSPINTMLDFLIENGTAILEWIQNNPKLTKNILLTVAAVGAFLVVGGSLLKLLSSIAFAMSGLQMLKSIPLLFGKMVVAVLPFIAIAGLAYTAWDKNLGGIQDKITWFVNNIGSVFSVLGDAWGDNTLSEENFLKAKELGILPFIEGILMLKYYWDFFVQGFKTGFTSFFEGLVNSLSTLGIDIGDLATKLFDFLDRLTQPGAEEEWVKLGEALGQIIAGLATLSLLIKVVTPIIQVFAFFGKVISWVGNAFKTVWQFIKWIGASTGIIAFFKDMGAAISLMKEGFGFFEVMGAWFPKLAGFFLKIGGAFTKFGGWIVAGAKAIGAAIMGVLTAIAGFLGLPVWAVVAIIVAIVAVITLIIVFRKQIGQFFVWLWNVVSNFVSELFKSIGEVLSKILKAILNAPFVKAVIGVIKAIIAFITGVAKIVGAIIGGIAKVIWATIKGVFNFIIAIVQGIWKVIKAVANLIWTLIKTVASIIVKIVNVVYQFFRMIFLAILAVAKIVITAIADFFNWLWGKIQPIVQAIGDFFSTVFNWINVNVITPFANFFATIFDWIGEKASMVADWIYEKFSIAADWIKTAFNSVADFFTGIWDAITEKATAFFDWIAEKIAWVTDGISKIGNFFGEKIDGVGDFFKGIGDKLANFVGLSTGGYVKEEGLAVLHPNEVVVNDEITKGLRSFLKGESTVPNSPTRSVGDTTYDNRVNFAEGSIIIQIASSSDSDLEKVAEKKAAAAAAKAEAEVATEEEA